MIRGVSFILPQTIKNPLYSIFSVINVSKYYWYCIKNQTEVWNKPFGNDFFDRDYYDGQSFSEYIKLSHYIVFLKLQAYCSLKYYENISTYDDFLKSDCQFMLLVFDCNYVEIYSKDKSDLNAIFQKAKRDSYDCVEYITDINDSRVEMNIL